MFWKKKNTVEFEGFEVVLSKRCAFDYLTGKITKHFLAYKHGNEWRGLVGYEQFREEIDIVNKKLNLILTHLNLEYVPETEKKEPAKLVDRVEPLGCFGGYDFFVSDSPVFKTGAPKKKKRGRPKKK